MNWKANEITSEGKGKLPKIALNDRRLAITQRVLAVGRTVPALCPVIESGNLILSSWFSAFQSEISTLIPLYVNHTDSGGNWDGQTTIPMWTEAAILTAIGDASRLPAPTDPLICAAWLNQQRKIINLLRWTKASGSYKNKEWITVKSSPAPIPIAIAEANALYDIAPWIPMIPPTGPFSGTDLNFDGYFSYQARITNVRATYYYQGIDTTYSKSVDVYMKGTHPTPIWYGNYTPNLNSVIDKYKKSHTSLENNLATQDFLFEQDKPSQWADVDAGFASFVEQFVAVFKFDGPNGFTFKDWTP